ncbi:hypothetical protein LIER_22305 [Lithospermum erythrorhizon]|uniref:ENT domain-containing protein n=1 Tax=Lithospermum erythrorhizon TaxID=34254 RepID=A0AAV3QVP2_LITER
MESQIHLLEQEAYLAVLCAFQAQSDAISWEKELLLTDLRKELRVSDNEHRDLLSKVNADDLIHRIREWRMAGCPMVSIHHHGNEQLQSPAISAFNKKQRTPQSVTVPYGSGLLSMPPEAVATTPQPYSDLKRGSKRDQHSFSSLNPVQYQPSHHGSIGTPLTTDVPERMQDSLIGKKVMTRWPKDNNFYEAVIAEYNPSDGRHAFVYDRYTPKETWEWVHLNEIAPADIRWIGEEPKMSRLGCGAGQSGLTTLPNGERGRDSARDLEILDTETLLQKIEKVLGSSHPDLHEIEKAKNILKEHEEALIDVIAKLADACGQ